MEYLKEYLESGHTEISDFAHERADGDARVIYYGEAEDYFESLSPSEKNNAYEEAKEIFPERPKSPSDMYTQLAYCALRQEVQEALMNEIEDPDEWIECLDGVSIAWIEELKDKYDNLSRGECEWEDIAYKIVEDHGLDLAEEFRVNHFELLVIDSHGIYIPQIAAESLELDGSEEDLDCLKEGPSVENEWYWEAWDEILSENEDLHHDGDLWRIDRKALEKVVDLLGEVFSDKVFGN